MAKQELERKLKQLKSNYAGNFVQIQDIEKKLQQPGYDGPVRVHITVWVLYNGRGPLHGFLRQGLENQIKSGTRVGHVERAKLGLRSCKPNPGISRPEGRELIFVRLRKLLLGRRGHPRVLKRLGGASSTGQRDWPRGETSGHMG